MFFRLPLYEGVDWNSYGLATVNGCIIVSLFTREWIEIPVLFLSLRVSPVSLFTREWIEINSIDKVIEKQHAVSLFTREWIEMTGLDAMTMQGFSLPLYEGVDWNWTTRRSMQTCWKSPSLRGSGLKSSGVSKRTNLFFVSLFTREWIEIFCWTNANKCEQSPSLRGSGLKLPVQGRTASHAEVSLFTREWIEIESAPHSRYLTIQSPSLRGSGLK